MLTREENLEIEKEFLEKNPGINAESFAHWLHNDLQEATVNRLARAAGGCDVTFLEFALMMWESREMEVCA